MTIACPVCNKDDRIWKVSTLVEGGQSTSSTRVPGVALTYSREGLGVGGFYGQVSTERISLLAKKLSLPKTPSKLDTAFWRIFMLFVGLPFGALGGGIMVFLGLGFLFEGAPGAGLWFLVMGSILLAAFLMGMRKLDRVQTGEDTEHEAKKQVRKILKKVWERLYYCERDGLVFDPKSGQSCETDDLGDLLYSLASNSKILHRVHDADTPQLPEFVKLIKGCLLLFAALTFVSMIGIGMAMGYGVWGSLVLAVLIAGTLLLLAWLVERPYRVNREQWSE